MLPGASFPLHQHFASSASHSAPRAPLAAQAAIPASVLCAAPLARAPSHSHHHHHAREQHPSTATAAGLSGGDGGGASGNGGAGEGQSHSHSQSQTSQQTPCSIHAPAPTPPAFDPVVFFHHMTMLERSLAVLLGVGVQKENPAMALTVLTLIIKSLSAPEFRALPTAVSATEADAALAHATLAASGSGNGNGNSNGPMNSACAGVPPHLMPQWPSGPSALATLAAAGSGSVPMTAAFATVATSLASLPGSMVDAVSAAVFGQNNAGSGNGGHGSAMAGPVLASPVDSTNGSVASPLLGGSGPDSVSGSSSASASASGSGSGSGSGAWFGPAAQSPSHAQYPFPTDSAQATQHQQHQQQLQGYAGAGAGVFPTPISSPSSVFSPFAPLTASSASVAAAGAGAALPAASPSGAISSSMSRSSMTSLSASQSSSGGPSPFAPLAVPPRPAVPGDVVASLQAALSGPQPASAAPHAALPGAPRGAARVLRAMSALGSALSAPRAGVPRGTGFAPGPGDAVERAWLLQEAQLRAARRVTLGTCSEAFTEELLRVMRAAIGISADSALTHDCSGSASAVCGLDSGAGAGQTDGQSQSQCSPLPVTPEQAAIQAATLAHCNATSSTPTALSTHVLPATLPFRLLLWCATFWLAVATRRVFLPYRAHLHGAAAVKASATAANGVSAGAGTGGLVTTQSRTVINSSGAGAGALVGGTPPAGTATRSSFSSVAGALSGSGAGTTGAVGTGQSLSTGGRRRRRLSNNNNSFTGGAVGAGIGLDSGSPVWGDATDSASSSSQPHAPAAAAGARLHGGRLGQSQLNGAGTAAVDDDSDSSSDSSDYDSLPSPPNGLAGHGGGGDGARFADARRRRRAMRARDAQNSVLRATQFLDSVTTLPLPAGAAGAGAGMGSGSLRNSANNSNGSGGLRFRPRGAVTPPGASHSHLMPPAVGSSVTGRHGLSQAPAPGPLRAVLEPISVADATRARNALQAAMAAAPASRVPQRFLQTMYALSDMASLFPPQAHPVGAAAVAAAAAALDACPVAGGALGRGVAGMVQLFPLTAAEEARRDWYVLMSQRNRNVS